MKARTIIHYPVTDTVWRSEWGELSEEEHEELKIAVSSAVSGELDYLSMNQEGNEKTYFGREFLKQCVITIEIK